MIDIAIKSGKKFIHPLHGNYKPSQMRIKIQKIRYIVLSLVIITILTACGGKSRGNSNSNLKNTDSSQPSLFPAPVQTASTKGDISAALGGEISVGTAVLKVPPGALAKDASLEIREYDVPTLLLNAGDGAFGGQVPLNNRAVAMVAKDKTGLNAPVTLVLPIDPNLLPENISPETIHISAVVRGMLVPQDLPVIYDPASNKISVPLALSNLPSAHELSAEGIPPLGAGIPLLVILPLLAGSELINPVIATYDDARSLFMYDVVKTDYFCVRYRPQFASKDQAEKIAAALEKARPLFVDQLGFNLPNLFNFDFRYTVFVDDFENYEYVKRVIKNTKADGFCLPGSALFEGASYINAAQPKDQWPTIAVHEYFHALQFGVLETFIPNLAHKNLYPESGWMFEGSTSALAGRVMQGETTKPARVSYLVDQNFPQLVSLFDPNPYPVAGVAQDFFYFLEKHYGNVNFYKPMFAALCSEFATGIPASVAAADEVIRQLDSTATDNLGKSWTEFVKDMWIDHPTEYGGKLLPKHLWDIEPTGKIDDRTITIPPLCFYVREYKIPALGLAPQNTDFELKITIPSQDTQWFTFWLDVEKDSSRLSGYPDLIVPIDRPETVRVPNLRSAVDNKVRLITVSRNPFKNGNIDIRLEANLSAPLTPKLTLQAKDESINMVYGVDVSGENACIVTWGGYSDKNARLRIYDAAGAVQKGSVEVICATGVKMSGGYAYVATGYRSPATYIDMGLFTVVDISSPSAPKIAADIGLDGKVRSIDIAGTTAYATVYNQDNYKYNTLWRIDVSNPSWCDKPPCSLFNFTTPVYTGLEGGYDIKIVNNLAFIGDGIGGLKIIDTANSELIGEWDPDESGSVHGLAVDGNRAYLADVEEGIWIMDISDPAVPKVIGKSDIAGFSKVAVSGRWLFAAGSSGLAVLDIASETSPVWLDTYFNTPSQAEDIVCQLPLVYLAARSGLYVLRFE
ncbi:hypothetical protein HY745_14160 [Candidatus Desantisbacteria bacterium]|nr:hypothetical protein [Candidatus Desantisbacteria bacterium]